MKIKTNELTGAALDWAVAKAIGCEIVFFHEHFSQIARLSGWTEDKLAAFLAKTDNSPYYLDTVGNPQPIPSYSTSWSQGGALIEQKKIDTKWDRVVWLANSRWVQDEERVYMYGPTRLIAAMRCYVASRLGDEVEVPDELV